MGWVDELQKPRISQVFGGLVSPQRSVRNLGRSTLRPNLHSDFEIVGSLLAQLAFSMAKTRPVLNKLAVTFGLNPLHIRGPTMRELQNASAVTARLFKTLLQVGS